jgi:hypothetical protein
MILRLASSFADMSLLLNKGFIGKATRAARRDSKHIDIDDGVITEEHCVDTVARNVRVRYTVNAKFTNRGAVNSNVAEVLAGIGNVSSAPSSRDMDVNGPKAIFIIG